MKNKHILVCVLKKNWSSLINECTYFSYYKNRLKMWLDNWTSVLMLILSSDRIFINNKERFFR